MKSTLVHKYFLFLCISHILLRNHFASLLNVILYKHLCKVKSQKPEVLLGHSFLCLACSGLYYIIYRQIIIFKEV